MHWIESFLNSYGLIVVLIGTFFEGEIIVTVAGFAAHQGLLNPYAVAICSFLGSFTADQLIFQFARSQSKRPWMERLQSRSVFSKAVDMLGRYPTVFILAFRFLYGLRTVGPAAIALAGVSHIRFLILNAISAAIWAVTFTSAGYFFGQTAEIVLGKLGKFEHRVMVALCIAVAMLLLGYAVRNSMFRKKSKAD